MVQVNALPECSGRAVGSNADAAGERGLWRRCWVCFTDGTGAFTREALAKARHPFAMMRKAVGLQDKEVSLLRKT
jgi:hypothetical protein